MHYVGLNVVGSACESGFSFKNILCPKDRDLLDYLEEEIARINSLRPPLFIILKKQVVNTTFQGKRLLHYSEVPSATV